MEKVKVFWDGYSMAAIANLCDTLSTYTPEGHSLERLVVLEWYEENFTKILRGEKEFKFKLKQSQAYAFRRLLLVVGMNNLIEDAIRNIIVAELDRNLHNQKLLTQ